MSRTTRIRIHRDYYDVLQQFGGLSKVANAMADLVYAGLVDVREMPRSPEANADCIGCSVTMTSPGYEALVEEYGVSSPKVSIRRWLYYFVENELYSEYPTHFKLEAEREAKTKQLTLNNLLRRTK